MIPIFTRQAIKDIQQTNAWVSGYRRDKSAKPQNFADIRGNCMGVLLQDIWGNQTGAMQLTSVVRSRHSMEIAVAGQNPIADSNFRIRFIGTTETDTVGTSIGVVRVQSIATADEMQTEIRSGLAYWDVDVSLGNPYKAAALVEYPRAQPEINIAELLAYVGVWIITFRGPIIERYQTIFAQIEQDSGAFMKGLATVVTQPTQMVLSGTVEEVHDLFCRPRDYPWRIGETAVCVPIQGLGLGIIASSYRDMTSVTYATLP